MPDRYYSTKGHVFLRDGWQVPPGISGLINTTAIQGILHLTRPVTVVPSRRARIPAIIIHYSVVV